MSMTETVENAEPLNVETSEATLEYESEKTSPDTALNMLSFVTDFHLIINTAPAQTICEGNWEPGKIGLRQFTTNINHLWQGLEKEDPYAEWQLLKIYEATHALKTQMQEQVVGMRKQFNYLRGMRIQPFRNPKPFVMEFSKANPMVLLGASLISQIDILICQIVTLKQMGVVPLGVTQTKTYRDHIQSIYVISEEWEESGITRQEILENTKKAQRFQKKYGRIPEDILERKTTLPFLSMEE